MSNHEQLSINTYPLRPTKTVWFVDSRLSIFPRRSRRLAQDDEDKNASNIIENNFHTCISRLLQFGPKITQSGLT